MNITLYFFIVRSGLFLQNRSRMITTYLPPKNVKIDYDDECLKTGPKV
jgi:hypothetical protein